MKTKTESVLLVVLFTLITSVAQTIMKIGTNNGFFNLFVLSGLFLYSVGTLVFIVALKEGELSVLYPLISLSFIWVAIISYFYLGESLSLLRVSGMFFIIGGVSLIGGKK